MTKNIHALPVEEQKAIQRDKWAALLAHKVNRGEIHEGLALSKIHKINDPEKVEDLLTRFHKYRAVNDQHEQTAGGRVEVRANRPRIAGSRKPAA